MTTNSGRLILSIDSRKLRFVVFALEIIEFRDKKNRTPHEIMVSFASYDLLNLSKFMYA